MSMRLRFEYAFNLFLIDAYLMEILFFVGQYIVKSCASSAQVVYKNANVKNAIKKLKNAIEIFSLTM